MTSSKQQTNYDVTKRFLLFTILLMTYLCDDVRAFPTRASFKPESHNEICLKWENTMKCTLPCNYHQEVCMLGTKKDQPTQMTCTWEALPNVSSYRVAILTSSDNNFHGNTGSTNFTTTCEKQVECPPDSSHCKVVIPLSPDDPFCSGFFPVKNQRSIQVAYQAVKNPSLMATSSPDDAFFCSSRKPFHLCNMIDWEAPQMKVEKINSTFVQVTSQPSSCIEKYRNNHFISYKVRYWKVDRNNKRISNNTGIEYQDKIGDDNMNVILQLDDASRYNIEVSYNSLVMRTQWSNSNVTSYLTEPSSGVDDSTDKFDPSIKFICIPPSEDGKRIQVQWKKSGEIDSYDVIIKSDDFTKRRHYDVIDDDETMTSTIDGYRSGANYDVIITSNNQAGISPPSKATLNHDICHQGYQIRNCSMTQYNTSSAIFEWSQPQLNLPEFYIVTIKSMMTSSIMTYEVDQTRHQFVINDLKHCTKYEIEITSKHFGQLVGSCKLDYLQLEDELEIEITQITSNEANVQMSCQHTKYQYSYLPLGGISFIENKELVGSSFNITNLKPFTKYLLKVRQVYQEQMGNNQSEISFTTSQTAPREAPAFDMVKTNRSNDDYRISWGIPQHANGIISKYMLKITNNKLMNKLTNCLKTETETRVCEFNNETFSQNFNLSPSTGVQMAACTVNGTLCSDWSNSMILPPPKQSGNFIWMIPVGVLIFLIVFLVFFTKSHKLIEHLNLKPQIDQQILDSFLLRHNPNDDVNVTSLQLRHIDKGPDDVDKNLMTSSLGGGGEKFDPVDEWRRNLKPEEKDDVMKDDDVDLLLTSSETPLVTSCNATDEAVTDEYDVTDSANNEVTSLLKFDDVDANDDVTLQHKNDDVTCCRDYKNFDSGISPRPPGNDVTMTESYLTNDDLLMTSPSLPVCYQHDIDDVAAANRTSLLDDVIMGDEYTRDANFFK